MDIFFILCFFFFGDIFFFFLSVLQTDNWKFEVNSVESLP